MEHRGRTTIFVGSLFDISFDAHGLGVWVCGKSGNTISYIIVIVKHHIFVHFVFNNLHVIQNIILNPHSIRELTLLFKEYITQYQIQ